MISLDSTYVWAACTVAGFFFYTSQVYRDVARVGSDTGVLPVASRVSADVRIGS